MMKVSVRVRGEWLAVPCPDPKQSISWLGEEALRRYTKLQPATYIGNDEKVGCKTAADVAPGLKRSASYILVWRFRRRHFSFKPNLLEGIMSLKLLCEYNTPIFLRLSNFRSSGRPKKRPNVAHLQRQKNMNFRKISLSAWSKFPPNGGYLVDLSNSKTSYFFTLSSLWNKASAQLNPFRLSSCTCS